MADIIQLRGGTAADATSVNPVLHDREIGIETDTRKFKIGDGSTAWNSLPYSSGGGLTQVIATDANIEATPNSRLVIPDGVMTAARTIDMSAFITDGQQLEIYMLETTQSITFLGGTQVYTYGNEILDTAEPLRVTTYKITMVNGQLRQ